MEGDDGHDNIDEVSLGKKRNRRPIKKQKGKRKMWTIVITYERMSPIPKSISLTWKKGIQSKS